MIQRLICRCSALLCACGLLMWCIAGTLWYVSAADTGSLTIVSAQDDAVISGMEWSIYYVGDMDDEKFVFAPPFDRYYVSVGDMSASALTDLASTLSVYVRLDHVQPLQTNKTNQHGRAVFDGLKQGMYLLDAAPLYSEPYSWDSDPVIVFLDEENDYTLDAYPKIRFATLDGNDVNYTVKKVWANDETQPWRRSTYITVELYCDGELTETVRLDESNDWSYDWTSDDTKVWLIKEKEIPPGYVVTYRANTAQYVIVNTYDNPSDDSSMTDVPPQTDDASFTEAVETAETDSAFTDETGESRDAQTDVVPPESTAGSDAQHEGTQTAPPSSEKPSTDVVPGQETVAASDTTPDRLSTVQGQNSGSASETKTTAASSDAGEKLPQTGQLWWPVPALAAGGLLLIGAGLCLNRKGKE